MAVATPSDLAKRLKTKQTALRKLESSDGGNWRKNGRMIRLREEIDKLSKRLGSHYCPTAKQNVLGKADHCSKCSEEEG